MPSVPIEQFCQNLPSCLQALYCIHGEEDLLRIEALDALRLAAKQQGYLNREVYQPETANDWEELLASAHSIGLFSDLKLLEIHIPNGKLGKHGGEALCRLLEHLPEDTIIVLMLPKLEKAQLQSKWYTAVTQKGVVLEAKAVTSAALPQWIRKRLQQHQLQIHDDALALFSERVEGNLLAAKQEVDKLSMLYPAQHSITIAEAEQAVASVARFDVFQLAQAWMSGDVQRTLHLIDGLEAEGEEPVLLLWAVADDIRTLIRLSAALKQGQSVQAVRNSLRLWGDKQKFAPLAVQRLTVQRLLLSLQKCAQIDRVIKGAEEGDSWIEFRQLLRDLAQ